MSAPGTTGGRAAVAALLAHGVERVFCVPGESYLAVLDGLYDVGDRIQVVACRHESGAAFMAAAAARLTGRPGVVFVTRGPGATNASIALHVAQQASIPLVVGVGQVPRAQLGREAFQEVDYERFLGPLVKHVEQVSAAHEVAPAFKRAFRAAAGGRPGPAVVALPEDVLTEVSTGGVPPAAPASRRGLDAADLDALCAALDAARRPLILAGGGAWPDAAAAELVRFAEANELPVMTAFRRHDLFDNTHRCFGGYLGLGAHAGAWPLAAAADCVLVLGARLDDPTTRGYTLFRDGVERRLVHVYPEASDLGRNYVPDPGLVADADVVATQLAARGRVVARPDAAWREEVRAAWLAEAAPPRSDAPVDPGAVMQALNARLGDDAIVTVDAGNFSRWPQRYRHYRRPGRLLAPVNGAMGFGVPAAIGAALSCPARQVVGCVGDGGMLMTGMELATAAQYGARPLILVFNNGRYGTIEMHQDIHYPGRHIATALENPDFAALARSFGLHGARVSRTAEFAPALDAALAAAGAALIELEIEGY